jgi:hypothetical protein
MLQLAAPVLTFSTQRAPFHDGMNEEKAAFAFACPACAGAVSRNVFSAISSGETWYRSLSHHDQQALAEAFGYRFSIEGPRQIPYAWMPNGRRRYRLLREAASSLHRRTGRACFLQHPCGERRYVVCCLTCQSIGPPSASADLHVRRRDDSHRINAMCCCSPRGCCRHFLHLRHRAN